MGFSGLKPKQIEAVSALIRGEDVFVSLLTAYGKSLIYGILPSLFDLIRRKQSSIAIVVSPLVALMRDQQHSFTAMGLKCQFLDDLQSKKQYMIRRESQLVILSPENIFHKTGLRDMLLLPVYQENLVAFVINEAHCIKTW